MNEADFLNAIDDSRCDEEAIRDYAEWLSEKNDPRGDFLSLELERTATEKRLVELEWRASQARLFEAMDPEWLDRVYPLYVVSPMVGTYYASPTHDSKPFVAVGDWCRAGAIIAIIEAMHVFSEIPAEMSGIVSEIYVRPGDTVDYGKRLMLLKRRPRLLAGG